MKKTLQVVLCCMTLFIVLCGCEKPCKCAFCKGTRVCNGVSCSFCGATGRQFRFGGMLKPLKEKRIIPKTEYEEWLEEHRRSQDGPQIGNGG
jgi:hypothetical protein